MRIARSAPSSNSASVLPDESNLVVATAEAMPDEIVEQFLLCKGLFSSFLLAPEIAGFSHGLGHELTRAPQQASLGE
jgi:hypothetical protein